MADSALIVTPGSGASVRTFTLTVNGVAGVQHEGVSICDPATATAVAKVTATGELQANTCPATTAALTKKAGGGNTSVALVASNANRLGLKVYNNTSSDVYILEGGAACSVTDFTVKLATGDYWETLFRGAINYFSATGITGNVNVTEETP